MDKTDLRKLAEVFARAERVVTLMDVARGDTDRLSIGLRHDVDNAPGAFENAIAMAEWEAGLGYASTFYFLHDTHYWGPHMADSLKYIASLGHEIGFHNNALAVGRERNCDPFFILELRLAELRKWSGEPVNTVSAHGDRGLAEDNLSNYQLWVEAAYHPYVLETKRNIEEVGVTPRFLGEFGLYVQGDWLLKHYNMTDSSGYWRPTHGKVVHLDDAVIGYPFSKQLTVLQHPDWWPAELYS